jgi:2-haloacid dehalogenase
VGPAAILFDVFGTLLDVYSVQARAEQRFPGQGARVAQLWRDKQIEYTRLRSLSGRYEHFSRVTRDALQFTCEALRLDAGSDTLDELMQLYDALPAFPEVGEVLTRLDALGIPLGVLSNGEGPLLERCLAAAGLRARFVHVLSADAVRVFKTAEPIYRLGSDAVGRPAHDILFVSSNGWDACGAAWFGYTTCWINRAGAPLERLGVEPHRTGKDLRAVLAAVD